MTRLSFRPRPLDVNKKLPIVRSIKDLDGEDGVVNRSVHHGHIALDAENEPVLASPAKKGEAKEIPIPESQIVNDFDTLYPRNFHQPATYVRRRPARAETETFIEYDLDDDDEDWLETYDSEGAILAPDTFEAMLYQLELADSRARMKTMTAAAAADSQVAAPPPFILGIRVPVYLPLAHAEEIVRADCDEESVVSAVCEYWKRKREKWGKPILRRLQPPPAVTDTNPYNVFRPREKAHRPNTRRMQRRENDVASFEKLQQVKNSLEDAQKLLEVMQRREETKKELLDAEFQLQRAALQDPDVAKMYLEREAKRAKLLQQSAIDSSWHAAGTPAGPRLKVHPPAPPEDTTDLRSSLTKDSALDIVNKALNIFHSPLVTTKRRSGSGANAASQTSGSAAPTAVLAAAAAGNVGSYPPPPSGARLRLSSPSPEGSARFSGGDGVEGDGSLEFNQLHLQKRKRRRNMLPLRGAAAASAAHSRLSMKGQAGATAGVNRPSSFPMLLEPPRPVEPVMWFTLQVNPELLQKHLQVDTSAKGACTVPDSSVIPGAADDLQRTNEQLVPHSGPSDLSSSPAQLENSEVRRKGEAAVAALRAGPFAAMAPDSVAFQSLRGRPRFGRGGRLVFDRWDVLRGVPLGVEGDGSTETLDGPRDKENVLGQDVGKLLVQSEEKGNVVTPLSLRFAVHKHRSQPRWRHTAAKPPTPENSPTECSKAPTLELAREPRKLTSDQLELLPPLFESDSTSAAAKPKTHPVVAHRNGLQKAPLQHVNGIRHEQSEMRAPVPRNGIHSPVAQHLVPA